MVFYKFFTKIHKLYYAKMNTLSNILYILSIDVLQIR
jgi:hypothetical protein